MLTALVTFFPALMGSSALQLIFGDVVKKPLKALALLVGTFAAITAWFLPTDASSVNERSFFIAASLSVVAMWTWCLANADDPTFQDALDVAAPVGGSLDQPLNGDLSDFKH